MSKEDVLKVQVGVRAICWPPSSQLSHPSFFPSRQAGRQAALLVFAASVPLAAPPLQLPCQCLLLFPSNPSSSVVSDFDAESEHTL
jgi:hypothetical protein